MATYNIRVVTKSGKVFHSKTYGTEQEAQAALTALNLTSLEPGFVQTPDGSVVVNRAEVAGAEIVERGTPIAVPMMPWNPMGE